MKSKIGRMHRGWIHTARVPVPPYPCPDRRSKETATEPHSTHGLIHYYGGSLPNFAIRALLSQKAVSRRNRLTVTLPADPRPVTQSMGNLLTQRRHATIPESSGANSVVNFSFPWSLSECDSLCLWRLSCCFILRSLRRASC